MTAYLVDLVVAESVAASALYTVAFESRALAVAVLGDGEEGSSLANSRHADNVVAVTELYRPYAVSGARQCAYLLLLEAYCHAVVSCDEYLCVAVRHADACYLVASVETYRDESVLADVLVQREVSALYLAVLRHHDDELLVAEIGGLYHCRYLLVLGERKQIYQIEAA